MKKIIISIFAVVLIIILYFLMNRTHREIDTILINGKVYSFDSQNSIYEAIAIQGSNIIAVGSNAQLEEIFTPKNIIDLQGKSVFPGFVDGHAHILGEGGKIENIDLMGTKSQDEIIAKVADRIKISKSGDWILGRGWDQNSWEKKEFPNKTQLDAVSKNNPVLLRRVDGHAVWVNSKALELAKISSLSNNPEGGKIIKDNNGSPTGVLIDNAIDLVNKIIPPLTDEDIERRLLLAMNECARLGLTEVHDMGVDEQTIKIYKKIIDEGKCSIRIYAAIDYPSEAWSNFLKTGPLIDYNNGILTVRAVKLYMDGALGSRGAAFFESYSDDPGNRGLTLISEAEMEKVCKDALEKGFQVCTHAIGDRANSITLDVYEKVLQADKNLNGKRWRVEHAQILSMDDIPRFKNLGILPSMQPTHATSDMDWAEKRVGGERIKGGYAWKSILNTGSIIISGSDFPVEYVNPLFGIYSAITRQDQNGKPDSGWYPAQRMTREEAIKSFTQSASFGAFQESNKGSIEAGKWADLTILDRDIMKCPVNEIYQAQVEMTITAGRVVYKK
ncbi:MAG: amidohydrolase [Ignavibacteriales bacterium]|nr:amidohydrolase [Ignavibacteriales bacterium]